MKRFLLCAVFLFIGIISSKAQSLIVRRATKEYNKLHYATAAELYEEAIADGKTDSSVYLRIADSYFKIKNTSKAEAYYSKVEKKSLSESNLFQYVQSLLQNGKREEAVALANGSGTQKSERLRNIVATDYKRILSDSVGNKIYFLDFNSGFADFSPCSYQQGLVFVSSRSKGSLQQNVFGWNNTPFLNLYYIDVPSFSKKAYNSSDKRREAGMAENKSYENNLHADETKETSNDVNTVGYYGNYFRGDNTKLGVSKGTVVPFISEFNSKFHEGPVTFNAKEDVIIFTRNNFKGLGLKRDNNGVSRLNLYSARKQSKGWTKPLLLPFCSVDYSVGHPAFDRENKYLYFASDMPGGRGGTDIYRVEYRNGDWGQPKNLGSIINSDGNEMFPYVDPNGILYFSSDGHGGLGGLDIFASNFAKIKNVGYPVNSNKDDFGVSIDRSGKKGFFSSNRNRNGIDDDIYAFTHTKPIFFNSSIQLLVLDKITGKPIPSAEVSSTFSLCITGADGMCTFEAEPGSTYTFAGMKENYQNGSALVQVKEDMDHEVVMLYLENYSSTLYLKVTDRASGKPLEDVNVKISDMNSNNLITENKTDTSGDLRKVLEGAKMNDELRYSIHLAKQGYLSKIVTFNYMIQKSGEIPVQDLLDVKLDKIDLGIDIGKLIDLKPIYFDVSKFNIRPEASLELDKIVKVMNENPTMVIELGSHTDCRSSAQYNLTLSNSRAKASADYVVSKGINKNRIYGKGYGESNPVNSCACEGEVKSACTETEHQLNRRTEFIIKKM